MIWKGSLVALTHTECQRCGAIDSQIADEPDDLGEGDYLEEDGCCDDLEV